MRHTEQDHRDATGRKATYTETTYKELARRVAHELGLSVAASESTESTDIKSWSKKRAWGGRHGPRNFGSSKSQGGLRKFLGQYPTYECSPNIFALLILNKM